MRYFLHIGYKGTAYHGWQRQKSALSIQEVLETQLFYLLKKQVTLTGCGRTDTGVHAGQFFCHLNYPGTLGDRTVFKLNKMLPDDIAVFGIIPVAAHLHARYDARERTYAYYIHRRKDPYLTDLSALYAIPDLAIDDMKAALDLLGSYQNYRAFCRTPDRHKHTLCEVRSAGIWVDDTADRMCIRISANRFLKGMMRIIVHQLLEVGRGKLSVKEFEQLLKTGERPRYLRQAYPQGLHLVRVRYDQPDIEPMRFGTDPWQEVRI